MTETVIVALISAGGSVLIAMTALLLNYRGFTTLENRMGAIETRVNSLEIRVNQRFDDLTGAINELDKRLTRVEIKLHIEP